MDFFFFFLHLLIFPLRAANRGQMELIIKWFGFEGVEKIILLEPSWVGLSSQFLIHWTIHPSNQSLSNAERRMLYGTMPKTCQKSRYVTSVVHWCSHSVVEGHWVGQTGLGCPESPLCPACVIGQLLGGCVPWTSQAQSEADRSQCHSFYHFPVSWDFTWLP